MEKGLLALTAGLKGSTPGPRGKQPKALVHKTTVSLFLLPGATGMDLFSSRHVPQRRTATAYDAGAAAETRPLQGAGTHVPFPCTLGVVQLCGPLGCALPCSALAAVLLPRQCGVHHMHECCMGRHTQVQLRPDSYLPSVVLKSKEYRMAVS